jgi:hypothetical protein
MNRPIFFVALLASMLALALSTPAPAEVDPACKPEVRTTSVCGPHMLKIRA